MNSRILLIEDEPGLIVTVSDLLSADGHTVESAADGETGFAKANGGGYDLIILDVMLPRKTGFDICRELRQNHVDTLILILTAKAQSDGSGDRPETGRRRLPQQAIRAPRIAGES